MSTENLAEIIERRFVRASCEYKGQKGDVTIEFYPPFNLEEREKATSKAIGDLFTQELKTHGISVSGTVPLYWGGRTIYSYTIPGTECARTEIALREIEAKYKPAPPLREVPAYKETITNVVALPDGDKARETISKMQKEAAAPAEPEQRIA